MTNTTRILAIALGMLVLTPSVSTAASARSGQQTVGATTLSASYDGSSQVIVTATNSAVGLENPLAVTSPAKIDAKLQMDCTAGHQDRDPAEITIAVGKAELDPSNDASNILLDTPQKEPTELFATFLDENELQYKDWRCLTGTVDGVPFTFYFDGYGAFTTAIATAAVRDDLDQLYSAAVMKRLEYLKCPQAEFGIEIDNEPSSLCEYQIGRGSNTRAGAYIVTVPKDSVVVASRVSSNKYSQRVVGCPSKYERSEAFRGHSRIINKRLRTPKILRGSLFIKLDIADDAHRARSMGKRKFIVGEHGTNRAGFEESVTYPCRFTARKTGSNVRYKVKCANKLGNRIYYDFTIAPKAPKRKPKPSTPSGGGGGGGGGNQYAGMTCDQIGHPFEVTPGSDPEHDRDNDGHACESQ